METPKRKGQSLQLTVERTRSPLDYFCNRFKKTVISLAACLSPLGLSRADTVLVGFYRLVRAVGFGECLAEQLPRRRVLRVELHRSAQVFNRFVELFELQVFAAEPIAQQRRVLTAGEHGFEVGGQRHA